MLTFASAQMIACDNTDCHYQWVSLFAPLPSRSNTKPQTPTAQFHLPCVNLKPPLPDQWYCEDCMERFGVTLSGGPERRKGRKK